MKAPDSSLWFATDRGSDVLHNLAIKYHRFSRSNWLSSPTAIGSSHQPIAQAFTPSSAHRATYSANRSAAVRGIAPSEFDTS